MARFEALPASSRAGIIVQVIFWGAFLWLVIFFLSFLSFVGVVSIVTIFSRALDWCRVGLCLSLVDDLCFDCVWYSTGRQTTQVQRVTVTRPGGEGEERRGGVTDVNASGMKKADL